MAAPVKKRGRPPKPKSRFIEASPAASLMLLSDAIARQLAGRLDCLSWTLTGALAEAGLSYLAFREVRFNAPLAVKRRGNRPNIHLALLLADCAKAYEAETGKDARGELQLMSNGHTEFWSEVRDCVDAVLKAVGDTHTQSLRQQAKRAVRYL